MDFVEIKSIMGIFNQSEQKETPLTKEEFFSKVDKFVSKEPNAVYLIDG